ncbi:MAG TPA: sulfatase [Verrucomicrobiae bacterium]|nr:sulfatase [Verrucomicrobiae bacterium]
MRSNVLLSLLATLAALCSGTLPAATNPPNVLFLISDDLRTELSCYGSSLAKTPNIDRLAARGVRFDRAYCQFPLCNPSRASMLTGRHPSRTGVLGNRADFRTLHPGIVTLPQLFKENRFAALRAGKIFHGGMDDLKSWTEGGDPQRISDDARLLPNPAQDIMFIQDRSIPESVGQRRARNSDRWIVLEGDGESHGDYRTADRAIQFLRDHTNKPFFLGCGFVKPHSPPSAPRRFYELYPTNQIELPPDFATRPTVPEGFPRAAIRQRNADLFMGREASPAEARQMIQAYVASTSWMDWNVGRVLDELDRLGLRDRTIVVFWGDHGYQLGEKGKWSKAGSLFEQGTRSPLIIAAPRAKGNGKASQRIVEAIDIYPTLAELCGLDVPSTVDGRSLASLLENPSAEWNHPAFTVWSEDGRTFHGVSVRTPKYRYAEFQGGGGGAMLFDETADPHELRNLADDPNFAGIKEEHSRLIRDYIQRMQQ